jgi:hypothetical protein
LNAIVSIRDSVRTIGWLLLTLTLTLPRPANAGDDIRPAEYCTVVLAPKLAEKLQLTVVQRVTAAMLRDTLVPRIQGTLSHSPGRTTDRHLSQENPSISERAIMGCLDHTGERLRDTLTPQQIAEFTKIFNGKQIAPIRARLGPVHGAGSVYFEVQYTDYGVVAPGKSPVQQTVTQADGKTTTRTDINIEERRDDGPILAQMKSAGDAIEVLGAKDSDVQRYGALWLLKTATVADADRARVLAALTPHLDGPPEGRAARLRSERPLCGEAFCRWADQGQSAKLQELARLPKEQKATVAAALKALVRVDPAGAEAVVRARLDDFFFRANAMRLFEDLQADKQAPQEVVAKLLELLRSHRRSLPVHDPAMLPSQPVPGNAAATEPATMAADLLSGEQSRIVHATVHLLRTKPAAPNPEVSAALTKVLLENPNMALRVNAVMALEHWGTSAALPALQQAAEDPNRTLQIRAKQASTAIKARTPRDE